MDRSLFRFILRYSKRDQLRIVPFVLLTMVVYYASLDLPKTIINEAIQGGRFPQPDSTTGFFGLELGRLEYLFALSMVFLGLIVVNGWLKFRINTMKGWMGERMLRRLRFALYDYILRFPLARFRRVKAAEMASMVKDEVEPLGGFIGEAFITPLFLGGQALTAMFFILYQHWALGLIALALVGVQAYVIPRLRKRLLVLGRERQLTARALAGRIAETVDGAAEIHANATSNYERAEISARLGRIFRIRFEFYQRKFLIKLLNNFLSQVRRFVCYTVGGARVVGGWRDSGGLPQGREYWNKFAFGELSATAHTRREVLQKLVPRLKIAAQCSFEDKFLVVRGKLRAYKIHLGSGNILMSPNDRYLCIVESRGKADTGNLFLPFEGDSVLSLVISKALLLAADDKITDPTITQQIRD